MTTEEDLLIEGGDFSGIISNNNMPSSSFDFTHEPINCARCGSWLMGIEKCNTHICNQ